MNEKFIGKAKRLLACFVAVATATTMIPANLAMADNPGHYPYTLFAG